MRRTVFAVVGAIILGGSSAGAHHSYARFFTDQTMSIEGEVEGLSYINPHVILRVRAKDSFINGRSQPVKNDASTARPSACR